jgi:hypothetical protein
MIQFGFNHVNRSVGTVASVSWRCIGGFSSVSIVISAYAKLTLLLFVADGRHVSFRTNAGS